VIVMFALISMMITIIWIMHRVYMQLKRSAPLIAAAAGAGAGAAPSPTIAAAPRVVADNVKEVKEVNDNDADDMAAPIVDRRVSSASRGEYQPFAALAANAEAYHDDADNDANNNHDNGDVSYQRQALPPNINDDNNKDGAGVMRDARSVLLERVDDNAELNRVWGINGIPASLFIVHLKPSTRMLPASLLIAYRHQWQ
jgi:hypothetical protein